MFVDTNILLYYYTGRSEECRSFLVRCLNQEHFAFTSATVAIEALHKLMAFEAVGKGLLSGANLTDKLRRHPEVVSALTEYHEALVKLFDYFEDVYSVGMVDIESSYLIRREHGLLVNDSLILASMRKHQIFHLATADRDLLRVKGIAIYRPNDIED